MDCDYSRVTARNMLVLIVYPNRIVSPSDTWLKTTTVRVQQRIRLQTCTTTAEIRLSTVTSDRTFDTEIEEFRRRNTDEPSAPMHQNHHRSRNLALCTCLS